MTAPLDPRIAKLLELALSHEGRTEATGANDGPYVEWVLGGPLEKGNAWCAAWVMRMYELAGIPFARLDAGGPAWMLHFWKCRSVHTLYLELLKRDCRVGPKDTIEPGDLCIQLGKVTNAGATGHVDLVVRRIVGGHGVPLELECIGGNVGDAVRKTQRLAFAREVTTYLRPLRMIPEAA